MSPRTENAFTTNNLTPTSIWPLQAEGLFHGKINIMNNMMKLALIIGIPLGALITLLIILEPNGRLAFGVYICALLGICAVGYLFADKDIRDSLQKDGKLPRRVVLKVTFTTLAAIAIYLAWHFIKEAMHI